MTINRQKARDASKTTDESSDSGIKRVTITIHEDRHDRLTEFGNEENLSFSELARRGAEHYRNMIENDGVGRELQPLVNKIDCVEDQVNDIDPKLEELKSVMTELDDSRTQEAAKTESPDSVEQARETILALLRNEGPMSIVELVEVTDYGRRTVQRVISALEANFVIIEREKSGGTPVWEVR